MKKTKKIIIYIVIVLIALAGILEIEFIGNYLEENYHTLFTISRIHKRTLPDDGIAIITSKDEYKIGEEIFFGIQNKTEKTLFIENECPWEPIEIYMLENNVWRHLKAKTETIKCESGEDIKLNPYELKGTSFLPWSDIIMNEAGLYKLEVDIDGYKNGAEKEFRIIE